jgi:hypothetical protein
VRGSTVKGVRAHDHIEALVLAIEERLRERKGEDMISSRNETGKRRN